MTVRVVSSEIFGKFILNFLEIVQEFFYFICLIIIISFQVQHCKVMLYNNHVLDKQLSRSLCFNFMHCVEKK